MCRSIDLASSWCTACTNSLASLSKPPMVPNTNSFGVAALTTEKHGVVSTRTSAATRQAARSWWRLLGSWIIGAPARVGSRRRQRRQVTDGPGLVQRQQARADLSDQQLDLLVRRRPLEAGEVELRPPRPREQPGRALLEPGSP